MKYIIILFALTCACGPVKETDTTAYVRLTKTCDSLKLAHNTLAYQVAENRYYDSLLIEDVRKEYRTEQYYLGKDLQKASLKIDSLSKQREYKFLKGVGIVIGEAAKRLIRL